MSEGAFEAWVGRSETREDVLAPGPARALAATFDTELDAAPGAALPPLWIWLYFLPVVPMIEVGPDGHPKRGGFLPPVELPRRMWAGSRCRFDAPLTLGAPVERRSTILKVSEKAGRSGSMLFVTVLHETSADGRLCVREEQDIVYLPAPERFSPPDPTPLPACDWSEARPIDPVFLFRFSALTFNGHRIHYDRAYAMEVEKYPGLVVHGPLQALLLFEAARRRHPDRRPGAYQFRGLRPLFDFDQVSLNGRAKPDGGLELFTANGEGAIGMQASLDWV